MEIEAEIQEEKRSNRMSNQGGTSTHSPQGSEKAAQGMTRGFKKFLKYLLRLFFVAEHSQEDGVEASESGYWERLVTFFYPKTSIPEVSETETGAEEARNESSWVRMKGYLRSAMKWVIPRPEVSSPVQRTLTYEERREAFEREEYWQVLEVEEGAEDKTVKEAHRNLFIHSHPDKHPKQMAEATEECQWLTVAKDTILSGKIYSLDYELGKLKRQIRRNEQKIEEAEQKIEEAERKREEAEQRVREERAQAEQRVREERAQAEQRSREERAQREAVERELKELKQQLAKPQQEVQQEKRTGKENTPDNKPSFFPPRP